MQRTVADKRMAKEQAKVDEVIDLMKCNVEKVLERDEAISVMNERAHALQDNASQFELSTGKLKNSFWMENVKYTIIVLVLVAVVGIALYLIFRPSGAGFVYFSTPSNNGTSKEEN